MKSFYRARGEARWLATFFCAFCCIFAQTGFVRAAAKVRTTLQAKGDVWVGQGVPLVVELLSPGFFAGSPTFYLPHVPEVLILQGNERPVLGSEMIEGANYTIQRHELTIFSQRAGHVNIPSFQVHFSTREGAAAPTEHLLRTDEVSLDVKLPPGAEGLAMLISARDLKATEIWQPDTGGAKAGNAFTRTITFSASDVPAMAFPPFAAPDVAGLGVYPKAPKLFDQSERGTMRGERQDIITYICKRPGRFVVPAARFTWWDLDHHQLRTVDFPARTLEVTANAAFSGRPVASAFNQGRDVRGQIRVLGVVAGVVLLAGIGLWIILRRPEWRLSITFWRPVHLAPLDPSNSEEISK
jgi:hypothetical protein